MRVTYVSILWGEKHINIFMNYVIPSLIKTDNKETLKGQRYVIYTDDEGKNLIINHINFSELNFLCKITFKGLTGVKRNEIINGCFDDAVLDAKKSDSLIHLVTVDSVYSPNGLKNTLKKMEKYDACIIPAGATRVKHSFLDEYYPEMTAKEFTDAFIKHMHIETRQHFKDSNQFIPNAVMYIENKKDGYFVKSFYHQPGYLRINNIGSYDNLELDAVLSLSPKEVYCVKDSDEMMVASLSDDKYCGWEGNFNEEEFHAVNKNNRNRISELSFESGFLIKGKYEN